MSCFRQARPDASFSPCCASSIVYDRLSPAQPVGALPRGNADLRGLKTAREALVREGQAGGTMILISDLEILPDEVQRLVAVFADLRQEGFEVRIVPLSPRPEQRRLMEQLLGDQSLLPEPQSGKEALRAPGESITAGLPWAVSAAQAFSSSLALAANERVLARLEVSRDAA